MPSPSSDLTPDQQAQVVANILLAEAASDWSQGMGFVRDTMVNRQRSRKLPLYQVATQSSLNKKGVRVYQYTGAGRKDLKVFASQQPPMIQSLAFQLAQEAMQPKYQPKYPGIEHYVTQDLYNRRFDPDVSEWVRTYEPAGVIGSHVALRPPKRK